jgi:predicted ester cyclase
MRIGLIACLFLSGAIPVAKPAELDVSASNAAVIRAEHDKLNRGDWQGAAELYAEDTRNHGKPVGRAGVRRVLEDIWRTFPEARLEIIDLVAVGDTVVARCKFSGTHAGVGRLPVNGGLLVGVPPTHKSFEVLHIHWYRLRDGKIVDHYATRDDLGMMQQLGLLPAPVIAK